MGTREILITVLGLSIIHLMTACVTHEIHLHINDNVKIVESINE
jgi:hypothetical protein